MRSISGEFKEAREHLITLFVQGKGSGAFPEEHAKIVDHYFRRCHQESKIGHRLFKDKTLFALVAVGGYGRMELCLKSDIDILILFGKKIPSEAKKLVEEIFYPLWDLGLELGYAIRSVKDCIRLCMDDFEVLTSMTDSRFICGDSPSYLSLMEALRKEVVSKKAVAYGRWLEEQYKIRTEIFGDASHLLEPNLKEGIGGLRDYHHLLWTARAYCNLRILGDLEYSGLLSHNEFQGLIHHVAFMRLVRNHLHYLAGRKKDRLGFEVQEEIAQRLGFRDQGDFLAVEQFMGELHTCMTSVKSLNRSFISTYLPIRSRDRFVQITFVSKDLHIDQGQIRFDSAKAILSNPHLLMDSFEQSSALGCPLSFEARRLVREFLFLVDDRFRKSKKAVQCFLSIINGSNTFKTLEQMYETGFLEAFIPEFARIKERVQFDTYHIYPVGSHSLETVRYLKNLRHQKELYLLDVFSELPSSEPLFLAGLFHDIGKTGKDHARKGEAISRNILQRLGYDKNGSEDVLFLVRHHLLLVETAMRRDLKDEKAVVQCARIVGDIQRLKMLYLLTWADSKATGPRAWNDWIANMVLELFFKILHILDRGELAGSDATQRVNRTMTMVRRSMYQRGGGVDLDAFFEVMPPRYLLNTPPRDIINHVFLAQDLNKRFREEGAIEYRLESRPNDSDDCFELTFLSKDRPGLFSDMAGVLALHNINILSADICTWKDGTAVDVFKVSRPLDRLHPEETLGRVKKDWEKRLEGKLSLGYRLAQKAEASFLSKPRKPTTTPKVILDNRSSDFFTLIEVFADDRVGLLYLITRTLFDLRLNIRTAKISTKGDQAADVFYVEDMEGQKIEDRGQVKEIERALLHQLRQL